MSQNISEINNHKKRFLEYLEIEKGRSLKTINNYDRYLKSFFDFSKIKNASDISLSGVKEFRLWLNRQENYKKENLKKNTQNYYLIALRAFLKFLAKNDIKTLAPDKIELAKTSMRELDLISRKEFEKLLESPLKSNPEKIDNIRDKAILEMLYSTGLRVSELCSLNDDLDLNSDEFSIRGKGEKVRLVFLSDEAKKWTKKYLESREKQENKVLNEALFITSTGQRIHPRAIQRIIKKRSAEAGIMNKVTPHTIRHFFATDLLQNGADIRSVQMLLGHASINTTQVYTNISDKYLKEIHQKFHGKNKG